MKSFVNGFVALGVFLGSISGQVATASDSHGYYKKTIIKKVRIVEKSCTIGCVPTPPPSCRRCGVYRPFYRGYGTRFTGGPLQFRAGQPIRNVLRVPARLGVRAASAVGATVRGVGRGLAWLFAPRRFY